MFNLISRTLVRPAVLACIVFAGTSAALAQVPQSTPRPTPAPGDPTQTAGTGTDSRDHDAGAKSRGASGNAANKSGCASRNHSGANTDANTCADDASCRVSRRSLCANQSFRSFSRGRCRRFRVSQRLGVGSETLPLSLNDAIKRALENNNDIEVARDDVRIAETQLRALEGIFDPIFAIHADIRQTHLAAAELAGRWRQSGTTSTTTYSLESFSQKQFGRGGGNYFLSFANRPHEYEQQFQLAESVLLIEPVVTVYATTAARPFDRQQPQADSHSTQAIGPVRRRLSPAHDRRDHARAAGLLGTRVRPARSAEPTREPEPLAREPAKRRSADRGGRKSPTRKS